MMAARFHGGISLRRDNALPSLDPSMIQNTQKRSGAHNVRFITRRRVRRIVEMADRTQVRVLLIHAARRAASFTWFL